MHYRITASVTSWLRSRTRQPMTNELALLALAHWSICQKLNRVSSVQWVSYVALFAPLGEAASF